MALGRIAAALYPGARARPPRAAPAGPDPGAAEDPGTHLTDLGNVARLVRTHGPDLRFARALGWRVWDGRRWAPDETGEVLRRAQATVLAGYAELPALPPEARRSLARHLGQSERRERLEAMVRLAEHDAAIAVRPADFDSDPWALTVANGTLDLRTGALRPARREDLGTRLAPVTYDPAAEAPRFQAFLAEIFDGQRELIRYVQKVLGYACTGDTREQCFFLLYGTGANGKSTLLETVRALLGDYAQVARAEMLLARRSGESSVNNDVASLVGARYVQAVESESGRRLAEVLVKQLTGGDTLRARFLYREHFEFRPTLKLFLAANHKPRIVGTDHAIWRRVRLIPFTVTIPDEDQDRTLPDTLRAEGPGILRWLVEGCLAWQAEGLGTPDAVAAATTSYRAEMDTLGDFLGECCVLDPESAVAAAELYAAYRGWAERTGEDPMPLRVFNLVLTERGLARRRSRRARGWRGIRLRQAGEPDPSFLFDAGPGEDDG